MASLRDLLPLVTPSLTGCSDIQALQALRLSAIDWCERSRCWRYTATQALTTNGPAITIPSYGAVHEIERAEFAGEPLTTALWTDVVTQDLASGESPRCLTQETPDTITILPFAEGDLALSLWLKPRPPSDHSYSVVAGEVLDAYDELPPAVIRHHSEPIAWGALGRLYLQGNEPWADAALAALYQGKVTDRADTQAARSLRGQQRAPLRTHTLWC